MELETSPELLLLFLPFYTNTSNAIEALNEDDDTELALVLVP